MSALQYMCGFGNHHSSEARSGALPVGRNSPQRPPFGLYAEKLSGNAFTAPQAHNGRSWLYRIRPSAVHADFATIGHGLVRTAPAGEGPVPPNPLRWRPLPMPDERCDFIDGLVTVATNGNALLQQGIAVHIYRAARSMERRYFYNADGELLFVPEQGAVLLCTEFGRLEVEPGQVAVVPRGVRFRVDVPGDTARGYLCENYGARFELPERGPVGTDGLANSRDFEYPVAAFEDLEGDFTLVAKHAGGLHACRIGHSPLDVVAWHGNLAPYRYDLRRFNVLGSISYDHPDPSLFTVLTSPSDTAGTANADFVVFAPRWLVAENTFRPPWFHRNVMSEYMGLIYGTYDAKKAGFLPGGASLHNCMIGHGPDAATWEAASRADLQPEKLENTMAFMFESRYLLEPTRHAMDCEALDRRYSECWQGLARHYED